MASSWAGYLIHQIWDSMGNRWILLITLGTKCTLQIIATRKYIIKTVMISYYIKQARAELGKFSSSFAIRANFFSARLSSL